VKNEDVGIIDVNYLEKFMDIAQVVSHGDT
jgi:hypothetical protein